MSTIPIIIKTALNWQKEVALAEKAGIVPHPNSNWRWALRQIRAKNPTGARQSFDDLILKGKDLAKAKEKMGLPSNNILQKVKSLARMQRLGVEVGMTDVGKNLMVGEIGAMPYVRGDHFKIHTHPEFNRTVNLLYKHEPEYAKLLDKTLAASPSGMRFDRTVINEAKYKKAKELYNTLSEMMLNKLMNEENMDIFRLEKSKLGIQRTRIKDIVDKLRPHTGVGDAFILEKFPQAINTIMSPKTTGVHKYRYSLPRGVRSVYFKGGLD